MPSCFSALFSSKSSSSSSGEHLQRQQWVTPTQREQKDIIPPPPLSRAAHPSCGTCGHGSGDLLPAYAETTQTLPLPVLSKTALTTAMASDVHSTLAHLSPKLRELSLKMWDLHEIAFVEHKTHDLFVDFFQQQKGWKVTPHANGLETAWRAEFTHVKSAEKARFTGSRAEHLPTVGFQSELDALPGIGHACGHNLIAIGGVGAALSVAAALIKQDVSGRVVLLGTPAEEGGGGKALLYEDGAYEGMDACLMIHPTHEDAIGPMLAVVPITVSFTGATSHAGAAPEHGINAQDACILSYNNISLLRQQLATSVRVHGIIIPDADWAPNVIPGKSKMVWNVRSTTRAELQEVKVKILKCFEAAALATGCKLEIEEGTAYDDMRNLQRLADDYTDFVKDEFGIQLRKGTWMASTDFGNITHRLPSVHPLFRIPIEDPKTQSNHTVGFTAAARTTAAHELTLQATEGIAVLGARVLAEKEYRDTLWKEWKDWKQAIGEKVR